MELVLATSYFVLGSLPCGKMRIHIDIGLREIVCAAAFPDLIAYQGLVESQS
jgi:hypothetical protein